MNEQCEVKKEALLDVRVNRLHDSLNTNADLITKLEYLVKDMSKTTESKEIKQREVVDTVENALSVSADLLETNNERLGQIISQLSDHVGELKIIG